MPARAKQQVVALDSCIHPAPRCPSQACSPRSWLPCATALDFSHQICLAARAIVPSSRVSVGVTAHSAMRDREVSPSKSFKNLRASPVYTPACVSIVYSVYRALNVWLF